MSRLSPQINPLTFRAGVVPAVTFQQVNAAPDGQNRADGDDEGLKHRNRLIEKSHSFLSRIPGLSRKNRMKKAPASSCKRTPVRLSPFSYFVFRFCAQGIPGRRTPPHHAAQHNWFLSHFPPFLASKKPRFILPRLLHFTMDYSIPSTHIWDAHSHQNTLFSSPEMLQ